MFATEYLWTSTCEYITVGCLVSTWVPTFHSHLEITALLHTNMSFSILRWPCLRTNQQMISFMCQFPVFGSCCKATTFSCWLFCHQRNQCLGYFCLFTLFALFHWPMKSRKLERLCTSIIMLITQAADLWCNKVCMA